MRCFRVSIASIVVGGTASAPGWSATLGAMTQSTQRLMLLGRPRNAIVLGGEDRHLYVSRATAGADRSLLSIEIDARAEGCTAEM